MGSGSLLTQCGAQRLKGSLGVATLSSMCFLRVASGLGFLFAEGQVHGFQCSLIIGSVLPFQHDRGVAAALGKAFVRLLWGIRARLRRCCAKSRHPRTRAIGASLTFLDAVDAGAVRYFWRWFVQGAWTWHKNRLRVSRHVLAR